MNAKRIARICHEVNRAYCRAVCGEEVPSWAEAPEWMRGSAEAGVKSILDAKETVTPEFMHKVWMEHKLREGWVHGEVKDAEKKTHPCLVPYAEVPPLDRAKDHLFIAVVYAMREMYGEGN